MKNIIYEKYLKSAIKELINLIPDNDKFDIFVEFEGGFSELFLYEYENIHTILNNNVKIVMCDEYRTTYEWNGVKFIKTKELIQFKIPKDLVTKILDKAEINYKCHNFEIKIGDRFYKKHQTFVETSNFGETEIDAVNYKSLCEILFIDTYKKLIIYKEIENNKLHILNLLEANINILK